MKSDSHSFLSLH